MFKREKIRLLQARVEELEFLLCAGKHDYVITHTETVTDHAGGIIDFIDRYTLTCRRCHKRIRRAGYEVVTALKEGTKT